MADKDYYGIAEAARLVGCHRATMARWVGEFDLELTVIAGRPVLSRAQYLLLKQYADGRPIGELSPAKGNASRWKKGRRR